MDINFYKDNLIKQRRDVKNNIKRLNDYNIGVNLRDATDELSVYDNHPADIATETYEQEKNIALRKHESNILSEIDSALKRIKSGSFGVCIKCGKEIGNERLKALPYTSLCIDCANDKSISAKTDKILRPIEEEVLPPYYGSNDTLKESGFDAEDTFETVLKYSIPDGDPSLGTGDYTGYADTEEGRPDDVENISNSYYKSTIPEGSDDDYNYY